MREVAAELASWLAAGERVALATVVRIEGTAPRPLGATAIAASGDRMAGSVSNGCVESAVYEEALAALARGRARLVHYGISDELAFTVGLSCGGAIDVLVEPAGALHADAVAAIRAGRAAVLARILAPADRAGTVALLRDDGASGDWGELAELLPHARAALRSGQSHALAASLRDGREATVFLEALPPPATLVILGATHTAVALARFAKALGQRVVVADPREPLASRERFPDADDLVHLWPDAALARLGVDDATAIVLLSHDPKFDRPGLIAALRTPAFYVGAIGSQRTNEARIGWLREAGFDDEQLARLHAPVGLDIGARSAEEIALAILAEVVAVRHERRGGSLSARRAVAAV